MLLVPRQLRRSGMTGNVPYYGGRFTPAQAYAASHRRPPAPPPPPPAATQKPVRSPEELLAGIEQLRETGVITEEEYADLRDRVVRGES